VNTVNAILRTLFVILGVATAISVGPPAAAQETLYAEVGDWIRISYSNLSPDDAKMKEAKGRVIEIDNRAVTIRSSFNFPPLTVAIEDIRQSDVRTSGMPRVDYMATGAGIGLGAGVAMGVLAAIQDDGNQLFSPVTVGFLYSILFVPIGLVVGGVAAQGEEYSPCNLGQEPKREYSIEAVRNGMALVVRF
jgi:hypothetical protein